MVAVFAIVAIALISVTTVMNLNWSKANAENNAFAKDCNDRGGIARFDIDARQCIGAHRAPSQDSQKVGGK
jgi:hypothetical protein